MSCGLTPRHEEDEVLLRTSVCLYYLQTSAELVFMTHCIRRSNLEPFLQMARGTSLVWLHTLLSHLDEASPAEGLALVVVQVEDVPCNGVRVLFQPAWSLVVLYQPIHDAIYPLKVQAPLDSILHARNMTIT